MSDQYGKQMLKDEDSRDFMLEEFRYHVQELLQRRKQGEVRVNLFITIAGAVLGGTGILVIYSPMTTANLAVSNHIFFFVSYLAVLIFGIFTLFRMIRRNLDIEKEIRALNRIRRYFFELDSKINRYIRYESLNDESPFDQPYDDEPARTWKLRDIFTPINGGLIEMVVLINSFLMAIIASIIASILFSNLLFILLLAALGFSIAWIFQFLRVKGEYDRAKKKARDNAEFPRENLRKQQVHG
jgi:hypothetical protein